jgi:EAL domain-containing protein (putative c-di-GMP-specific phosphodiesterase class I)/DNA-binding response OmpR family regulator
VTTTNVQAAAPILIVDDSEAIREDIAYMLQMEGLQTMQAKNGLEALTSLHSKKPGLVICDLMMPEMDGFAFLGALRADPAFWEIPVLAISALDDRRTMRQVMQLGADDFLSKPFSREELVEAVKSRMVRSGLVSQTAQIDPVSGLLHRAAFTIQLDNAAKSLAGASHIAVVIIKLTKFNRISTLLGNDAAQSVVETISGRLLRVKPVGSQCSYFGTGVFALFLAFEEPISELQENLNDILTPLTNTVDLAGRDRHLSITWSALHFTPQQVAEYGAVSIIAQSEDIQRMDTDRDVLALDGAIDSPTASKLELPQLLRQAIEEHNEHFSIAWQPQVDAKSQQCHSAEMLLRWNDPRIGFISPCEFIQIAESWALMNPLAEIGLHKALTELTTTLAHHPELRLGINVSPVQLGWTGFTAWLFDTLDKFQVSHDRITVEITESLGMECVTNPNMVLGPLRDSGMQIALDDFGTGFSSLSLLNEIRIDELKIDRAFVRNIATDQRSYDLCKNMIQIAHGLNARVVAEGVEDVEQRDLLCNLECDLIQGYLYSKPIPAADFSNWLTTQNQIPS